MTRTAWAPVREHLAAAVDLEPDQRAAVLAATRRWWVRRSVMRVTPWNRVALILALIAMATCLLLPVALTIVFVPPVRAATWRQAATALASYLTVFGLIATFYFARIAPIRLLTRLGRIAVAAVATALVAAVTGIDDPATWMAYGLVAGVLAAVVVSLGHWSGQVVWANLWAPMWRRPLTGVAPTTAAIALMWHLLNEFDQAPRAWHEPKARSALLAQISETVMWFEYRLPRAMRFAGLHGPAFATIRTRHRRAAQLVADLSWRLIEARSTKDQAQVRLRIAHAIAALAAGDWDTLPEPVQASRRSRAVAVIRRLAIPLPLTAAAFGLPYLPGFALTGPTLTSIQATLITAAALSLIPSDGSTRDRAIDALRETN